MGCALSPAKLVPGSSAQSTHALAPTECFFFSDAEWSAAIKGNQTGGLPTQQKLCDAP